MSLEHDDAMAELIPEDHESRHLPMTAEQTAHLNRVQFVHGVLMDEKYRRGQRDKADNLWQRRGLLKEAIEENIDQAFYLHSLDEQIRELVAEWKAMRDPIAASCAAALERLLGS